MSFDENSSDEILMQAYQFGANGAFDILFKRHSSRIYGFLLSRLNNRNYADDVFQATFLKLHQARRHYDPKFPFAPWLFTVCKSVLTDHQRKQSRIREDSNEEILERSVDARVPTPKVDKLTLEALTERERNAIELRYFDELHFDEIAKKLETSPVNVRQIISRGIRNLKVIAQKKRDL